jgi:hypothetical protein
MLHIVHQGYYAAFTTSGLAPALSADTALFRQARQVQALSSLPLNKTGSSAGEHAGFRCTWRSKACH